MRRWEKDFERRTGRKPTEADIEASAEMAAYRQQLRGSESGADHGDASSSPFNAASSASSDGAQPVGRSASSSTTATTSSTASRSAAAFDAHAEWAKGSDYHELLRSRVSSHGAVNGFEGVSLTELHSAASSFAAWDLDHDGVLNKEEALSVLASLAEDLPEGSGAPPDAQTLDRLYAILDRDGNGVVDFNEFLAVRKMM